MELQEIEIIPSKAKSKSAKSSEKAKLLSPTEVSDVPSSNTNSPPPPPPPPPPPTGPKKKWRDLQSEKPSPLAPQLVPSSVLAQQKRVQAQILSLPLKPAKKKERKRAPSIPKPPEGSVSPIPFAVMEEIVDAVEEGKTDEALKLIQDSLFTDQYRAPRRLSALFGLCSIAVKSHQRETLAKLLQVSKAQNGGTIPEHWNLVLEACAQEDVETVKVLIDLGCNPNCTNREQDQPLHIATAKGNIQIVRYLLDNKADPNSPDGVGNTPLHYACRNNDMICAKLLLEHKANPNLANDQMATPLHLVARRDGYQLVDLLIKYHANATAVDDSGSTPLFIAYTNRAEFSAPVLAKSSGTHCAFNGMSGIHAIHAAAEKNDKKAIQIMCNQRVPVDTLDRNKRTALLIACNLGDLELVQFLVKLGANVNVKGGDESSTPLYIAAQRTFVDIVKFLLLNGANPNIPNQNGWTPLYIAATAGEGKGREVAFLLLENGANPDVQNLDGWTALHTSCKWGNIKVMDSLLDHNANPNIQDSMGRTPLVVACEQTSLDEDTMLAAIKLLLRFEADPRIQTKQGLDALATLALKDFKKSLAHSKLVELLASDGRCPPNGNETTAALFPSPLASVVRACVEARKQAKGASQVEYSMKETQYKEFLRAAKELISHKDANLDIPINVGDERSILTYIVLEEIDVLIQHPKIQKLLDTKWGSTPKKENETETILQFITRQLSSRRLRFILAFLLFLLWLSLFTTIALYGSSREDTKAYFLGQSLKEQFLTSPNGTSFTTISDKDDFWAWMKTTFVSALFKNNQSRVINNYDKLFRGITLRQFRVKKNNCDVPDSLRDISVACVNHFSSSQEDKSTYGNSLQYESVEHSGGSFLLDGSWYPQKGGFSMEMDANNMANVTQLINQLEDDWIDFQTAAVFLELTAFNPNINRFCNIRLAIVFSNSGKTFPIATFDATKFLMYFNSEDNVIIGCEIVFVILYILFLGREIMEVFQEKGDYIKNRWNVVDQVLYLLLLVVIIMRFVEIGISNGIRIDSETSQHAEFERLIDLRKQETNVMAVAAIFMWIRMLKYLRFIESCGILLRIIQQMIKQVVLFILVFMVFLCGFSMAFHLILGLTEFDYRTWGLSILVLVRIATGDFNWEEIEESRRWLASGLFFIYLITSMILLLNLLIAMLNSSYTDVIEKATSEYLVERASLVLAYGIDKVQKPQSKITEIPKSVPIIHFGASSHEEITINQYSSPATPVSLMTQVPTQTKEKKDEKPVDIIHDDGTVLCSECGGVDGHLTSCSRFGRKTVIRSSGGLKSSKQKEQDIPEVTSIEQLAKMIRDVKEQQLSMQQLLSSNQEKAIATLKTELGDELGRSFQKLIDRVVEEQKLQMQDIMNRLSKRLPQSEFDYVYL